MAEKNKIKAVIPIKFLNAGNEQLEVLGRAQISTAAVKIESTSGKIPDYLPVDLTFGGREGQILERNGQVLIEDLLPPSGTKILTDKKKPVVRIIPYEQDERKKEQEEKSDLDRKTRELGESGITTILELLARRKKEEETRKAPDKKEGQPKVNKVDLMQQKIREEAYAISQDPSRATGSPEEDWLKAERTVLEPKIKTEAYFISQDPRHATGNPDTDWAKADKQVRDRELNPEYIDPQAYKLPTTIKGLSEEERQALATEIATSKIVPARQESPSDDLLSDQAESGQAEQPSRPSLPQKEENQRRRRRTIRRPSFSNPAKALKNLKRLRTAASVYSLAPILLIFFLFIGGAIFLFGGIGGGGIPGVNAGQGGSEIGSSTQDSGTDSASLNPIAPGIPPTEDEFSKMFHVYDCFSGTCVLAGPGNDKFEYSYNLLKVPLSSDKYRSLLTSKGFVPIWFYPRPDTCSGQAVPVGGTCGGAIDGGLKLWGFWEVHDLLRVKESVIHETGHIIMQRNPGIMTTSDLNTLAQEDGSKCYTYALAAHGQDAGYYINTYANKNNGIGGGALSESFAETTGLYVMCGPGVTCGKGFSYVPSITDYATTCPNTAAWTQEHVFGGVNFYSTVAQGVGAGTTAGGPPQNIPPNSDACEGKLPSPYDLSRNPLHKNYGDPNCNFNFSDLFTLLKQNDPQKACVWWKMAPMENGLNPNGYTAGTKSSGGGWGVWSMNGGGNDGNGTLSHGDVEWHLQVYNATHYVAERNGGDITAYFDSARQLAGTSRESEAGNKKYTYIINGQTVHAISILEQESPSATTYADCKLP